MISARAVFASCPLDFAKCSGDPTPLPVEEGKNATFNATVIHVGGGGCGFQQEINHVRLIKINPQFGIDNELLLSCAIDDSSPTPCRNSRVSLSRGNDPGGFEFVFTLVDAVADMNSSLYEVIVDVTDPVTSSLSSLSKMFRLEIGMTTSLVLLNFPLYTMQWRPHFIISIAIVPIIMLLI